MESASVTIELQWPEDTSTDMRNAAHADLLARLDQWADRWRDPESIQLRVRSQLAGNAANGRSVVLRSGALLIASLVALLVACGGDSIPPDISKIATDVGCPSPRPYQTKDASVHEAMACGDGRRIFTFNSNDVRDTFRERFEPIGMTFEQGNGYLVYTGGG